MAPQQKQSAAWAAIALTAVLAIIAGAIELGAMRAQIEDMRRDIADLKTFVYPKTAGVTYLRREPVPLDLWAAWKQRD